VSDATALFLALLASHMAWRAGHAIRALHWMDQPMMYSSLGHLGRIFTRGMPAIASLCGMAAIVWGVLHLHWAVPFLQFVMAGLLFSWMHLSLYRRFPIGYGEAFVGLGPMVGGVLLIATQLTLWVR
jgi:hypothetical protein